MNFVKALAPAFPRRRPASVTVLLLDKYCC